jgi:hypothetical protein
MGLQVHFEVVLQRPDRGDSLVDVVAGSVHLVVVVPESDVGLVVGEMVVLGCPRPNHLNRVAVFDRGLVAAVAVDRAAGVAHLLGQVVNHA